MYPSYSVAIRTLGTAGLKFEKEVASVLKQTVVPDAIYAYIPEGYKIPEFKNAQNVTWVYTAKGMVTQRSLPFEEIQSDYILFLDDDVELAPDSVARLFDGLQMYKADAIVANIFANHKMPIMRKLLNALCGSGFFVSSKWGLKVRKSGHFSYNLSPSDIMFTQTGAGACSLVKKEAYLSIHFEEERWIEAFGYAFGDDQLFFNKMYQRGLQVLVHYNSGVQNLDAATGGRRNLKRVARITPIIRYILWHRTQFLTSKGVFKRTAAIISYAAIQFPILIGDLLLSIKNRQPYLIAFRVIGIVDGIRYTRSRYYKNLAAFA